MYTGIGVSMSKRYDNLLRFSSNSWVSIVTYSSPRYVSCEQFHHHVFLETHVLVFKVGDEFLVHTLDENHVEHGAGVLVQEVLTLSLVMIPDGR